MKVVEMLASSHFASYTNVIMNRKQTRKEQILQQLNEEGQLQVVELSKHLGVSQVTIRQDLISLEEQGLLQRVHGGAIPHSADDIANRLAINHSLKNRIATMAASLVKDGETVFIESGSTCALLAFLLGKYKKDVTVISNSVFIAHYVRQFPSLHVILLGGEYQGDSEACVGSVTKEAVGRYFTDKCFFGIDGFDKTIGFTGSNQARSEIVSAMKKQCNRMIALSTSDKFFQRGVVQLVLPREVDTVITDAELHPDHRAMLEGFGIQISTCERNEG
jgi:DeoR/GlpR family transcriptional regulator of sugar metabolism